MPDYGCWPVWEPGGEPYALEEEDLPISPALRERLWEWAGRFDAILDHDYPPDSAFASPAEEERFREDGRVLARDLAAELGPGFTVEYRYR